MTDTRTASSDIRIRVSYDHEARAQYQYVSDKPIAYTVENKDGRLVDHAADGTIVGIETLR